MSSTLCRFAGKITVTESFRTRKISLKIHFLKAADIICPSLLTSCGSVRLKPTTSLQLTSRLQAAVGPHSAAAAAAAAVFSLVLDSKRKREREKNHFHKESAHLVHFQSVARVLHFTSGDCTTTKSSYTHGNLFSKTLFCSALVN